MSEARSFRELPPLDDEPEAEETLPGSPPPGSLLETVLEHREAELADKHFDVDVPGYRGHLLIRLQPLAPGVLSQIGARAARAKDGSAEKLSTNSDVIIKATREVMGRRTVDAEPEPLVPGETLRIDAVLAETLHLQAGTARGLLLELFGFANDPTIAIANAANEFAEWCGQTNSDVADDVLGKSSATRE